MDPKTMVERARHPKMILEGTDIGRGQGIPKGMDGYHVMTRDITVWHVIEGNSILLPDESFGQFHSGNSLFVFLVHFCM